MNKQFVRALLASTCIAAVIGAGAHESVAAAATAVPVVADGIGGVVSGTKGPEAGVWVIAETNDLATRFIKVVVTDDQGRFMLPELPKAKYQLWVRGYGLVDSARVEGAPGKNMNLTAVQAPSAKAAAEVYPPNYWLSLIQPPPESDFPGTGPKGNGISPRMLTQQMWVDQMKGCMTCHQQGDRTTRTLLDNTPEGWAERITKSRADGDHVLGNHGSDFAAGMQNAMTQFGRVRGLAMWSDWSKRIAGGAVPEAPPRPAGIERNIVLTSWDWANGRYVHDNVSTDRHDPTVNANGPIYGVIGMIGFIEVLDPKTGKQEEIGYKVTKNKSVELLPPGEIPDAFPHNPMLDSKGRVWITERDRYGAPRPNAPPSPDKLPYCTDPAANKFAKYWPMPGKAKTTAVIYDPASKKIEGIPMCNDIHHLMVGADKKTMYFSDHTPAGIMSWVNMDTWDATKDPVKSMGWCPMVLDTNSTNPAVAGGPSDVSVTPDRTAWNQPVARAGGGGGEEGPGAGRAAPAEASAPAPFDPKKDSRITLSLYGVDTDVKTGAMWYSSDNPFPTGIARFSPGTNPPETCKSEYFEPTKLANGKDYAAYLARGVSVDSNGVAWVPFSSGHLGKLDRTKCKVLSGPTATGQHCPEGWTYYDSPGPKLAGTKNASTDFHYLNWVDLHDTLGLGKDTPVMAGTNSDSLIAFDSKTEKFTVLRVPYPMGFHTRGMDGRIDDRTKGWKGKGIYATYASEPVWHQEGGEDASGPQLVKFQVRPDPLAY